MRGRVTAAFITLTLIMAWCPLPARSSGAATNAGGDRVAVFAGHHLTPVLAPLEDPPPPRGLYAPSEGDDPALRGELAALLGGGTIVDYFDARFGTPEPALLAQYDWVFTWVNFSYQDEALFGDRLADFADAGGTVVLGLFCAYTDGYHLSGRITQPGYSPVYSPRGEAFHFVLAGWAGDYAGDCLHRGVLAYDRVLRDDLAIQGNSRVCGTFEDGVIANALSADHRVVYLNGAAGAPITTLYDPPDQGSAPLVANAARCEDSPTAIEAATWGALKSLYR